VRLKRSAPDDVKIVWFFCTRHLDRGYIYRRSARGIEVVR
jgi:hypothetical protein